MERTSFPTSISCLVGRSRRSPHPRSIASKHEYFLPSPRTVLCLKEILLWIPVPARLLHPPSYTPLSFNKPRHPPFQALPYYFVRSDPTTSLIFLRWLQTVYIVLWVNIYINVAAWPNGKALVFGTKDCAFESRRGRSSHYVFISRNGCSMFPKFPTKFSFGFKSSRNLLSRERKGEKAGRERW